MGDIVAGVPSQPHAIITTWMPGVILPADDLSPNIVAAIVDALSPAQTCALTMWAEARSRLVRGHGWVSNPLDAMVDILTVILNRSHDSRWQALGPKGVCLQPYQFSCWLPHAGADANHDPQHLADNFEALMCRAQQLLAGEEPSAKLLGCLAAAEGALDGALVDTLAGATHYYATWITPPTWVRPPAAVLVAERFGHRFYRAVR